MMFLLGSIVFIFNIEGFIGYKNKQRHCLPSVYHHVRHA